MNTLSDKLAKLEIMLRSYESVVIGFSGGVDSTFLAAAAYKILGEKALAVTAYSATLPQSEKTAAIAVAKEIGIRHELLPIDELASPDFRENDADRCYHCKTLRFSALVSWARQHEFQWVLEGSNQDDLGDYRPGIQAVSELDQVASPLLEAGFTKKEIRQLSKKWGLATWNKPSAACLSSRVAYGEAITEEKLGQIEQAEEYIRKFCSGSVRVRHHGQVARIEVQAEWIPSLCQDKVREQIVVEFRRLGFTFITIDLNGYQTGSMNALLQQN
ncbi:MAG: ATP-dependent sacrificial sulfur transferase LarE [Sporomusaceae bacterium]|nr:ATP-dependent sacrificial sulfur transferase LarE [Sporomusaceae bacterium]